MVSGMGNMVRAATRPPLLRMIDRAFSVRFSAATCASSSPLVMSMLVTNAAFSENSGTVTIGRMTKTSRIMWIRNGLSKHRMEGVSSLDLPVSAKG